MQMISAFLSILYNIWRRVSSYRGDIESLHKAVNKADIDEVIDILKLYNNEEMIRETLCISVKADDISLVQGIMQHINIANVSDKLLKRRKCNSNDSPLFIACQKGNPAIVSLLCGSGFLINVIDEYNRTPLWAAVSIQQHQTADFLLSQPDIDVNIATLESYLGHQNTIEECLPEIVSLLIEKGADINITDSEHRRTPLHQACNEGTLEIVRHLLDNGANINAKDSYGMTSLFYCLRNGNFQIGLRLYLLDRVTTDSDAQQFQSYLNIREEGNKIMKYLVESGADINCRDTEDLSVLDYAYKTGRLFATFLLFKYGGMVRRNCHETVQWYNWDMLINANLANVHFCRHLVRHTSVFRKIYLASFEVTHEGIGPVKICEPFLSIISDTEIPLSLKDQCRICIRNTISTYTEPGLQFEKCINTLCIPKILKSFLMFEELEQFVSVRNYLPE